MDFELIRLDVVHRAMEAETSTNVIFLDACRDNPLSRNLARAMGTRSSQIGKGLAAVELGVGTLISFSTQPGNVALDGEGHNSPYAAALVKHISDPKEDLSTLLIQVRNDVMAATKDQQIPWEHSALRSKFYFAGIPPPPSAAAAGPTPEQQLELAFWASVKDSTNPAEIATYLDRYPNGQFAERARALVERHEREQKAEAAAREEARKRQAQATAAAEVRRLEEERRAREAAPAQERRRAENAKDPAEVKRLEEQRRAEQKAHAEAVKKAQEDARLAREAAEAAVKAAEEAGKAAERARTERAAKVAALTKEEAAPGAYDGVWSILRRSTNCARPHVTFTLTIKKSTARGRAVPGPISGSVAASGALRFSHVSSGPGTISYSGSLRGKSGSGTFSDGGTCNGTFTAERN